MRVFVDTSVWVAYFRGRNELVAAELRRLLDDDAIALSIVARVELLSGALKKEQARRLATLLAALPTYEPAQTTWQHAERWAMSGATHGLHFGAADLLVAATAYEQKGNVWSLDGDFQIMERLGWIKRHAPQSG